MSRESFTRSAAARLACVALALCAAACHSVPAEGESASGGSSLVSTAAIAERLHLERRALDASGRIVLFEGDGDEILVFPQTTVVSVNGTQFKTSRPIETHGGDAWLTKDDAEQIESLWMTASSVGRSDYVPRVEPPGPTLPPPGPGPTPAPRSEGRASYGEQPTASETREWSVSRLSSQWHYIVLHHSASASGNAAQFDAEHRKRGWEGLGYDFVIDNGNGGPDGRVEIGFRWREQKRGAHAGSELYNVQGIGICLVGDFTKTRPTVAQMRALSRLCNFLSSSCGIPRENYRLHGDVRTTLCPGPLFPRDFLGPGRTGRVAATPPDDDELATY